MASATAAVLRPACADLLLVEGDPTVNIKATRALRKIWKGGVEVARPLFR